MRSLALCLMFIFISVSAYSSECDWSIQRDKQWVETCYPLPMYIAENREMTQQEKDELFNELTEENKDA